MVKNGHFLIKNEFQRPRFGGGLFDRKKRVTFVVGYRFSSMEIVSEPAIPALKRRLRRNKNFDLLVSNALLDVFFSKFHI